MNRRDDIRNIAQDVLETFGNVKTKLEHLAPVPLPDKASVIQILDNVLEVLYPGYFGRKDVDSSNIQEHIGGLIDSIHARMAVEIYRSVRPQCGIAADRCEHCHEIAEAQSVELLRKLPALRARLAEDVQAGYDGDPAAQSIDEVIFSYPATFAITIYRIAHELYLQNVPLLPRIMTEHAHSVTGIDIHPGATIGSAFFIDHGTGVVIGETTQIGDRVKLYQGVTLGARSFAKDDEGRMVRGKKRHPTIEDDVVIYAGATILGGETTIGRGSVIGGNVWLTHSVPPSSSIQSR